MPDQDPKTLISQMPGVTRGTIHRLEAFSSLLEEWNQKFNLISKSTIPTMWERHFLDSAQLVRLLPKDRGLTIADMGSGAGFPGLVLAIMTNHKIHLIESIGKKASFLSKVISELSLDAIVHNERIENIKNLRADVVTARALKSLPELLPLANRLIKHDSFCIFLKGQTVDAELTAARKCWKFDFEKISSISDRSGCVLIVKNLHFSGGNVTGPRKRKK